MPRTGEIIKDRMNEFPLEVIKPFILAANHVFETVVYRAWNPNEMRTKWRKRPLNSILSDSDVNHLFPCVDTAVLATAYLEKLGLNPKFRLVTDKGALDEFRKKRTRQVHIDSWVELEHDGQGYGMDIGCGDLTLVKLIPNQKRKYQKSYYTTRWETYSQTWDRTGVLLLEGKILMQNPDKSVLDFLETKHNLVQVPFGLTKNDYFTFHQVEGQESVLDTNEKYYNKEACQEFTKLWTADFNDYINRKTKSPNFPKLIPIRYGK